MPESTLVVMFEAGGTRMALKADHVRQVLPMMELHGVPEMPPIVEGFVALKDGLVPVIDLATLLKVETRPAEAADANRQIIVANSHNKSLAWTTDGEVKLYSFVPQDFTEVSEVLRINPCVEGVIACADLEPATLLDPERLLLEGERAALDQMRIRTDNRLAHLAE